VKVTTHKAQQAPRRKRKLLGRGGGIQDDGERVDVRFRVEIVSVKHLRTVDDDQSQTEGRYECTVPRIEL
jgi:hypothetical protein